jgi:eukaryotic-like serine/threonine-protein kinase
MVHHRLGTFQLDQALGRGGMGVVYRAVHETGALAAVKVIQSGTDAKVDRAALFHREVEAIARLHHRGVCAVLDYGTVPEGMAIGPDHIAAGSPWYAMELASGSLAALAGRRMAWDELHRLLDELLAALAHAHARGVLHRDLKPANILRFYTEDGARYALSDFGIAWRLDAGADAQAAAGGTGAFMAPEQALGRWRDFGAWTDLYGLGCLAWVLCTGEQLFGGSLQTTLTSHVRQPVGAFAPAAQVPAGFEPWLRTLLAKHPEDRFQSAAEAAGALADVKGLAQGFVGPLLTGASDEDRTLSTRELVSLENTAAHALEEAVAVLSRQAPPRSRLRRIPPDWRTGRSTFGPKLSGVGLGVFGLRDFPLVGRELERNRLWALLNAAHDSCTPRFVLLTGEQGMGKSRLGRWLAERATELGAATVLRLRPGEGLRKALQGWFVLDGLATVEAVGRVRAKLERLGGCATDGDVLELVEGSGAAMAPLIRIVLQMAAERALVVWADDASSRADMAAWEEQLRRPLRGRVLGVLAWTGEAPEGWLAMADRIELGPLKGRPRIDLLTSRLDLELADLQTVDAITRGNPRHADALVRDWVERGILEHRQGRLRRRRGASLQLPPVLAELVADRLARFCAGLGAQAVQALERIAVMGPEHAEGRWVALLEATGVGYGGALVAQLHRADLVASADGLASFKPARIEHLLCDAARREGRLAEHHRAVAAVLRGLGCGDPERLLPHLVAGGEVEQAISYAQPAFAAVFGRSEIGRCAEVVRLWEQALERAGVPDGDTRWVEQRMASCRLLIAQFRFEDARRSIGALRAQLPRPPWQTERWLFDLEGMLEVTQGAHRRAADVFGALSARADELGDAEVRTGANLRRGRALLMLGRYDEARGLLESALESMPDDPGEALLKRNGTRLWLADLARRQRRYDEARAVYRAVIEAYAAIGHSYGLAIAENQLGELERELGNLEEAASHYERARTLLVELSHADALFSELNLAATDLRLGRIARARTAVHDAGRHVREQHPTLIRAVVTMLEAWLDAAEQRWDRANSRLLSAARIAERGGVDRDLPDMAMEIVRLAHPHSPPVATRAAAFARAQLERLDDPDYRNKVLAELHVLGR